MGLEKQISFFLLLLLFISPAYGFAEHSIKVEGEDAFVNTTIGVDSDTEINFWRIFLKIPENATIIEIKDTKGEVTNYTLEGEDLEIVSNKGELRRDESIRIRMRVPDVVESEYSPLKTIKLSLSGFRGKKTRLALEAPGLISGSFSNGFQSSFQNGTMYLKGEGPVNFKIAFSEEGKRYKHFVMFQDYNVSLADEFYSYIIGVTGTKPPFQRFPVVILPDSVYENEIGDWSVGVYERGGLIFIKESEMNSETNVSMLIHEATHGFNEQVLRWDLTNSSYFDEGVAKYLEYLVDKKLGNRQSEIFGETIEFTEDNNRYSLSPRKTPEDLWDYYMLDKDFMKRWRPQGEYKEFGYAYGELLIRNYLSKNSYDALHSIYEEFDQISGSVSLPETKWNILETAFGSDIEPCYSKNREELEPCLREVNDQVPKVPVLESAPEKTDFYLNFTNLETSKDYDIEDDNETQFDMDISDYEEFSESEPGTRVINSIRDMIYELRKFFERIRERIFN